MQVTTANHKHLKFAGLARSVLPTERPRLVLAHQTAQRTVSISSHGLHWSACSPSILNNTRIDNYRHSLLFLLFISFYLRFSTWLAFRQHQYLHRPTSPHFLYRCPHNLDSNRARPRSSTLPNFPIHCKQLMWKRDDREKNNHNPGGGLRRRRWWFDFEREWSWVDSAENQETQLADLDQG